MRPFVTMEEAQRRVLDGWTSHAEQLTDAHIEMGIGYTEPESLSLSEDEAKQVVLLIATLRAETTVEE